MKKVPATWEDDCQGKKDYDAELVSLSTRYWPRGGGFSAIIDGKWEHNEDRPDIKPSAVELKSNINFILESFQIATEKMISEAKAEIDAYRQGLEKTNLK